MEKTGFFLLTFCLFSGFHTARSQNPLIMDQFTADPTARVFEGRVYVYPSHDINCGTNWFCMEDYHVFSSENLVDWTDHGVIVTKEKVPWVDSTRYSMWAPDCYERDGKYYFYFPAIADSAVGVRGMGIGVAISDKPYGPFVPEPRPIEGVSGIDPNVFIDRDGLAYLYWAGMHRLMGARLKENMLELATEPKQIEGLPTGMKEGPFLFERNGIYYFTFPHVIEKTEALVYGMADNPLGPFEYKGIIMDEHPSGCWTNHHSILEYKGQWYLFYHHNDLSPDFDKNRSIRADSLFFDRVGTIQKVIPTLRGVGLTDATGNIQIDRYSGISEQGTSIAFLDTLDRHRGWKTLLEGGDAWVRYDAVDFGTRKKKQVQVNACSDAGGSIDIRIDALGGPLIARVDIPSNPVRGIVQSKLEKKLTGIHNLFIRLNEPEKIEIDWIRFK
jgi:hypothetical protein